MIWPKFISADTALVIVSFIVKPAMATAINRLPRILGERGKEDSSRMRCVQATCVVPAKAGTA